MRRRPSRAWSIVCAAAAGAWALFLLPPQLVAWYDPPSWAVTVDGSAAYAAVHRGLLALGLDDAYMVFGAAISLSIILLWWATGPVMAWLGWSGRLFSALLLATAALSVISYVSHDESAPLHALWGSEGLALVVLGFAGIVAAVATRAPGVRQWQRWLLGATLLIEIAFTVVLRYWPHGTVVGLAIEAGLLAAFAPRDED